VSLATRENEASEAQWLVAMISSKIPQNGSHWLNKQKGLGLLLSNIIFDYDHFPKDTKT